jgi:hypothetical protein
MWRLAFEKGDSKSTLGAGMCLIIASKIGDKSASATNYQA